MANDSYTAVHVEGYKFLIFTTDYLAANSSATKTLLLDLGVCPDCRSAVTGFTPCTCSQEPERWAGQWSVAITDADWPTVKLALERDRLKIKSSINARVRRAKFRDCAGYHQDDDLKSIRAIQEHTCYFCDLALDGVRTQVDHLTSISDGGAEWPSNLAITCAPCNATKGSKSEAEFWLMQNRKLGTDFIRSLRARRASQRPLKAKLDQVRVTEVKTQILEFETALNSALPPDSEFEIELSFTEAGINLAMGDMVVMTMPCSHRQIFQWSKADPVDWVRSLAQLASLTQNN